MKEREVFNYLVDGCLDIKCVVVYVMESYDHGSHWYVSYLCYMQNRLFILVENGFRYKDSASEEISYHIERILTDYTVIPEFDSLIYEATSENSLTIIKG